MHNLPFLNYKDTLPGFWEWDLIHQTVKNPILIDSLGYTDEWTEHSGHQWEKLIHPADWENLKSSVSNYVVENPQNPFVKEIRFFHKNGSIMHVLFVGKLTEFSAEGVAARMVGSHIDITSQKHAERNLMRVKNLLNETSRTAMVGGWELDLATNQVIWTDVTRDIFELSPDFQPARGDVFGYLKDGANKEKMRLAVDNVINNADSYDLEVEIITAKGNPKWIRCTSQPGYEDNKCVRFFGVVQDITERKTANNSLLIKEQQLTTFIKHCPVAICMLDKEVSYIAASDIWKSFFNLKEDDIIGKNHFRIFEGTPHIWMDRFQQALKGEVLKMDEDRFVFPNGHTEWLEWEIRPWYELPGQVGGIIMFVAVISEKHAFKEALIKARDQAEKSSRMKSSFLSVMSHEMRTPLNAVIGFINLLMENPRPDQVENMDVLRFSAENLLLLINDILDFSKLEADKVQLEEKAFSIKVLLDNIVASLRHEADKKNLDLLLILDDTIPEFVVGDSARLGQIILNLVNNAIKFTNSGSVEMRCQVRQANEDSATLYFEVTDTGIGIPVEQQENIFDMFSQADSNTTRKYGGTGLGLSISKRLLELMGSGIHLASVPLQGSSFSFQIVFARPGRLKPKEQQVVKTESSESILNGARILIVEDNPVNILLMRKFLTQWNCDCSIAQDGSIAYDLVRQNDYDLILMDLQMPVMDGYKASRSIRNLPDAKYQKIPIIALSATDKAEIETELANAGIDDFLSKPFVPLKLNMMLIDYLSR